MVYAAPGGSAASVALGSTSSSSQSQQHATTGVLAWPGGRAIGVAAGPITIGVGVRRWSGAWGSLSARRLTLRRCPPSPEAAWRDWAKSDTSSRGWPWVWWEACTATASRGGAAPPAW
ncbi:DUF1206 domain-containing protein [Pseudonocardia sp. T1-2H]|uniref:DUF1206 domain-containing protein n=1 Tax=Pseudonocardia sp. T1-2H TaxID=3128899 RepID=UPI0040544248